MRREIALPLAALLVLIPSAIFFFQSDAYEKEVEQSARSSPALSEVEPSEPPASIADTTKELEFPLPVRKSPDELLEEGFVALPGMEKTARDAAVAELIANLRAAGPQGLESVRKFLASARDVRFRDGFSFSGSQLSQAPTLRLALIEALREWSGSTGPLLEVLKSNATVWETVLAIRGLETQFPGTYRNEALEAIKRRMDDPNAWDSTPAADSYLFDVARHFEAKELLPQLHAMVMKEPFFRASGYVRMLDGFSGEARGTALDRLLGEPKFTEAFLGNPHTTNHYSLLDERMQAFVIHAFTQIWQPAQKLKALEDIAGVPPGNVSTFFLEPGKSVWTRSQAENDLAQARARKALLAELAPAADTPELQEALKKAREAVTREIGRQADDRRHENDAPADVEFASGEGKATIKGRRIESLELKSAPTLPTIVDDDSTPEAPR